MKVLKAASVQFCHVPGDKQANLSIITTFVEEASIKGVDLITFPEMCITGYWHVRNLDRGGVAALAEPLNGESSAVLKELAAKHNMMIGAGIIEEAGNQFFNTFVVALPDGKLHFHRKLHCFINRHMASGSEYSVFDTPHGWKVGILICYDNNIIENVRMTALKGADILLSPHQTGGCHTLSKLCMGLVDKELWENRFCDHEAIEAELKGEKGRGWLMKWLPARAHDNGMFLVFANGIGVDDDEIRTGNAMILDCYGNILAETWKAGDDMVIADLDPGLLDMCSGRRWITSRRPELYKALSIPTGKEIDIFKARFGNQQ